MRRHACEIDGSAGSRAGAVMENVRPVVENHLYVVGVAKTPDAFLPENRPGERGRIPDPRFSRLRNGGHVTGSRGGERDESGRIARKTPETDIHPDREFAVEPVFKDAENALESPSPGFSQSRDVASARAEGVSFRLRKRRVVEKSAAPASFVRVVYGPHRNRLAAGDGKEKKNQQEKRRTGLHSRPPPFGEDSVSACPRHWKLVASPGEILAFSFTYGRGDSISAM